MKKVFLTLSIIILLQMTACSQPEAKPYQKDATWLKIEALHKKYGQCQVDNDCEVISHCGTSVNKKFVTEANKEPLMQLTCPYARKNPVPVCEDSQCSFKSDD